MSLDEPFPLRGLPARVQETILDEFRGRHPSIQEVACIPDERWLAAPHIRPTTLAQIRRLPGQEKQSRPSSPAMSDAELLARTEFIKDELERIRHELAPKLVQSPADVAIVRHR